MHVRFVLPDGSVVVRTIKPEDVPNVGTRIEIDGTSYTVERLGLYKGKRSQAYVVLSDGRGQGGDGHTDEPTTVSQPPCTCGGVSPRCARCVKRAVDDLRGTAQWRGNRWAWHVAQRRPVDRPWPETTPRMLAIARGWLGDIAGDPEIANALAEIVIVGARLEWKALGRDPDRLRQMAPKRRKPR